MADERAKSIRMSGETFLNIQEVIQLAVSEAVETAVRKVVTESDSNVHRAQVDCRGELKRMSDTLHSGFQTVGTRLDKVDNCIEGFTSALAAGNTKFAVIEVEQRHLRSTVDEIKSRRANRPLQPLQQLNAQGETEDAPLISPKVWNALLLAAVAAVGTGVGAFVWDKIRGPAHQDQPAAISAPLHP